jgi:hypothetical protein
MRNLNGRRDKSLAGWMFAALVAMLVVGGFVFMYNTNAAHTVAGKAPSTTTGSGGSTAR